MAGDTDPRTPPAAFRGRWHFWQRARQRPRRIPFVGHDPGRRKIGLRRFGLPVGLLLGRHRRVNGFIGQRSYNREAGWWGWDSHGGLRFDYGRQHLETSG